MCDVVIHFFRKSSVENFATSLLSYIIIIIIIEKKYHKHHNRALTCADTRLRPSQKHHSCDVNLSHSGKNPAGLRPLLQGRSLVEVALLGKRPENHQIYHRSARQNVVNQGFEGRIEPIGASFGLLEGSVTVR